MHGCLVYHLLLWNVAKLLVADEIEQSRQLDRLDYRRRLLSDPDFPESSDLLLGCEER